MNRDDKQGAIQKQWNDDFFREPDSIMPCTGVQKIPHLVLNKLSARLRM